MTVPTSDPRLPVVLLSLECDLFHTLKMAPTTAARQPEGKEKEWAHPIRFKDTTQELLDFRLDPSEPK